MSAVLLHQEHFGMLLGNGTLGIRAHGRPPDLGLETRGVHGVRHAAHAFRTDAVVGRPVTFADLVAIVDIDPLETEFHDLGQGADDLVHGERALVAPGAPDRLVGVLRRNGGFPAVGVVHIAGELPQGLEEVALAFDDELLQCVEGVTGSESHGLVELLADDGTSDVPLAGHRHGHELENRLGQSHAHARVLIPYTDHGDAAAIVGSVHTQVVPLIETVLDLQDPVLALVGGRGLEGPDLRSLHGNGRGFDVRAGRQYD